MRRTAPLVCGAVLLLLGSCARDGVIAPAGPVASAQLGHMLFITAMVAIVVVPVFGFVPWVVWRYRFGREDTSYRPDWTFSWPLEIAVWGIPIVIVAVLSWQAWHYTQRLDPYEPAMSGEPLQIQVVGLDWKWLFIYPKQGIATVDQLVIPAGRDVALTLTADGPMMSFMVPQLGGQIYAMAGMSTQLHLATDQPGTFRGQNTQYNGQGFPQQSFMVHAVAPREFVAWAAQAGSAPALDAGAYENLERRYAEAKPLTFGSVEPGLYRQVVTRYAPSHGPKMR